MPSNRPSASVLVIVGMCWNASSWAAAPAFRILEIAADLGVGFAVNFSDVNGDGRPDIVVVDTARVIWYENPDWQIRTLIQDQTKRDNVRLAPYDLDGDRRTDIVAFGRNTHNVRIYWNESRN